MQGSNPRIRSLLHQAVRVTNAGKRAAAENMYRQIIEESPDTAEAWVGLANVLLDPAEQKEAYRQALAIEPENRTAKKALAALAEHDASDSALVDSLTEADAPFDVAKSWADLESARDWYDDILNPKSKREVKADKPVKPPVPEPVLTETVPPAAGEVPGKAAVEAVVQDEGPLFCANHSNVQTSLRCNNCARPICIRCANTTPVGYRCPQCIREREDVFYTATTLDYFIAAVSSIFLAVVAGAIVPYFGFFVIFIAALVGTLIGRTVFRLVGRRRGRWLPHLVAAAVVLGGLPAFLYFWWVWPAVYLFIATGAAYYQMK